jgi:RHS repeat-associated protein
MSETAFVHTFYLYNAHGDVVQLTDSAGNVEHEYHYDAFGVEVGGDPYDSNPFRYCAEYFDTETGTIYLRARNYDAGTGQFTSEDTHWNPRNAIYGDNPLKATQKQDVLGLTTYTYYPIETAILQSANLYAYCFGNPVAYHDWTGNSAEIYAEHDGEGGGSGLDRGIGIAAVGVAVSVAIAIAIVYEINKPKPNPVGNSRVSNANAIPGELTRIAGQYGNLKCVEARKAMEKHIKAKKQHGAIISLQFTGLGRFNNIMSISQNRVISLNGHHEGILYNGLVYCNVHPEGIPFEAWIFDFDGLGNLIVDWIYF